MAHKGRIVGIGVVLVLLSLVAFDASACLLCRVQSSIEEPETVMIPGEVTLTLEDNTFEATVHVVLSIVDSVL
jgi:hypothetical protein